MGTRTGLRPRPIPKANLSVSQLKILLTAIENDPSMYNASQSDMVAFMNIPKWLDLSWKLNECYGMGGGGACLDTQQWKYVLRHWADNVKNGANVMSRERLTFNKANPALTLNEAKELTRLERRFFKLMKKEDAEEIDDDISIFCSEESDYDIFGATDSGIEAKDQLMNVLYSPNDENNCPGGKPKKRTIHVTENNPIGRDVTKKLKTNLDANIGDGELQKQMLENQLKHFKTMSSEIGEHIASIQSRIHLMKDLWKHSCVEN